MEIKNNKIDLFGTIVTIKIEDTIVDENGVQIYGQYDISNKTVRVAKFINGVRIKDSEIKITILHELLHAIFLTGQYLHSSDDEPLVEWTARCLYKLLEKKVL